MTSNNLDNSNETRSRWESTRRTFLAGFGAATGASFLPGRVTAAGSGRAPPMGAVYYVVNADESGRGRGLGLSRASGGNGYRVFDGDSGRPVFETDDTAEAAFQFAFDEVAGGGGTVVAGAGEFQFGAPATMGSNTVLVGQGGTRFATSQTGSVEPIIPTDAQEGQMLPTGHDLIRVRGDNTAVAGIEFDGAGTQRANQAIQVDDSEGVLIANNRTVNGFQMALSFTRCSDVTVAGNEVVDPNWYGITSRAAPAGSDLDLRLSDDVLIANNRVSGMKFNNIATYNVSNFSVVGNIVFDGGHSLIACSPAQQGAIVGNVCRDLESFAPDPGGEAGIEIEYKETHVREGVAGTPRARSYDITITGNQIDNCPVGFLARTVPAEPSEQSRRTDRPYSFSVTGNTISASSEAGIRVRSGADAVLATNTVRDSATHVDVAEEFTAGLERGLNVTR